MEYEDIGQSREWEDIEYINKGWSDDKKYKIKTRENEELLLKISDIGQFAKKKKEFEIIKDLEEKKILMPKAVDIGVCNNDQSIYSLYTWIKGEDAAEEISKFSEEEQYKLGVNAGRYLKEIHSVNAPKSIEDWESRFNRKIDKKIENYKKCGIVLKDEKKILEYINKNRGIVIIVYTEFLGIAELHTVVISQARELCRGLVLCCSLYGEGTGTEQSNGCE